MLDVYIPFAIGRVLNSVHEIGHIILVQKVVGFRVADRLIQSLQRVASLSSY